MKKVLTTCFSLLLTVLAMGQAAPNFWQDVTAAQVFLPETAETVSFPPAHRLLRLDFAAMRDLLKTAPFEGTAQARSSAVQVQVPMPDGSLETFRVWEYSCMHPDLAARYPEIKSFSGIGVTNPHHTVKMGISPEGFYAFIPSEDGGSLVSRFATQQTEYYVCHRNDNAIFDGLDISENFIKFVPMEGETEDDSQPTKDESLTLRSGGGEGALTERRDYRFALACTGEYGASHGGTVASVLSTLVLATDVLNGVLERDASMRLFLIAQNDQLIFLDADTDPYVNANVGTGLLAQNESVLNSIIGLAAFDVGHVFTGGCTDVGGVVSGSICSGGKARGVTCHSNGNVAGITLSIAAHEMGHQLTAGHTFNNCPGSPDQFSSNSAWEPGSGSTLVSYYGLCGSQSLGGGKNNHYHNGTMMQYWNYTKLGGGNVCPQVNETDNHSPEVELPYQNGFYIPISTPFELEASATDADGDALTYAWEQMDRGPVSDIGNPFGSAPIFRVFDPSTSPKRYFPKLSTILANNTDITEVLPSYTRDLNFRCAVRDNNVEQGAGGVTWADVSFKATETAGPFRVTSPNTAGVSWKAGQQVEVTWNVANTDNALVNCKAVNIKLSTNGGQSFPYTVVSASPNDGSEVITVPDLVSGNVRLRIEASENIFFDLSNFNFEITPADEPSFNLVTSPQYQQVCVPNDAVIDFTVGAIGGFSETVALAVTGGLPNGVGVSFSNDVVAPGETTTLTFDMGDVTEDGNFEIEIQAIGGTDTLYQTLFFDVVYSNFSGLQLTSPADGELGAGLLAAFEWTKIVEADLFDIQVASSPTFEASTIIDEDFGLTDGEFLSNIALEASTIYYWRIRPSNECTIGAWSSPSTFQTFTVSCKQFNSIDIPQPISPIGLPQVESNLTILESGIISDVNIINLKGGHDQVRHLRVSLESPTGTEVVLFENLCGNVAQFDLRLDDESPFEIPCPPVGQLNYIPHNPLSAFDGENLLGNWTLNTDVVNNDGQGGSLLTWGIEFCASVVVQSPFLVQNETIVVKPLETRVIHNFELYADDPDSPGEDLVFTIVDDTDHGFLAWNGTPMGPGDKFSLVDINNERITYTNTNNEEVADFFTFHITDGSGGLFATPRFNILIDENATTDVEEELFANGLLLYPNPAATSLTLAFQHPLSSDAKVTVTDVQGRLIEQRQLSQADQRFELNLDGFAEGIYFLTVRTQAGVFAKKFIVQR